jgi:hypothetical protein
MFEGGASGCGTISCVILTERGITFENAWRPPHDKRVVA